MKIGFESNALRELRKLPKNVQKEFDKIFDMVSRNEKLPLRLEKKLVGTKLFEYRVRLDTNIYRAIAANLNKDKIILLVFQKKTQKTPRRVIKAAQKRFKSLN